MRLSVIFKFLSLSLFTNFLVYGFTICPLDLNKIKNLLNRNKIFLFFLL